MLEALLVALLLSVIGHYNADID